MSEVPLYKGFARDEGVLAFKDCSMGGKTWLGIQGYLAHKNLPPRGTLQ